MQATLYHRQGQRLDAPLEEPFYFVTCLGDAYSINAVRNVRNHTTRQLVSCAALKHQELRA